MNLKSIINQRNIERILKNSKNIGYWDVATFIKKCEDYGSSVVVMDSLLIEINNRKFIATTAQSGIVQLGRDNLGMHFANQVHRHFFENLWIDKDYEIFLIHSLHLTEELPIKGQSNHGGHGTMIRYGRPYNGMG